MTKRSPVSGIQNLYFDSEQLDANDLTLEQNYNNLSQSSLINNHVGSGVLPEVLNQKVLFDSLLVQGLLDGTNISAQNQPSDSNFGNQLEVELTGSLAAGKKTVKVAIIGLDFESNLQYDTFTFKLNEKQYTKKHYTNILAILFNDFIGASTQSFNLGGRVVIREAKPFTVARDPIMVAQDIEPNLFFRDFFVNGFLSLTSLLNSALPLYNIDNLNINTGIKENQILVKNDVSSQIGEKFLATTNNIQKVSLLLSVQNTDPGNETDLAWHGDLVISIYPLQSTVDCPVDIIPNLAIEFSPTNIPLAQISVNYNTLAAQGVLLDGNPQPVDFTFSNTPIALNNVIVPGGFYALTVKRSGSADKCDILIAAGSNLIDNSRVVVFTGTAWVDIPEDNLWFRIYTDSAKISDGQAYEEGHGLAIPKTMLDPVSNTTEDYSLNGLNFIGNGLFTAVLSSKTQLSGVVIDQRTGDEVESRQQNVPDIKLLNSIDLSNLESSTDPFIIGVVQDKNNKSSDAVSLSAGIHSWSFIKNVLTLKLIDDITDGYRYDASLNSLVSNLFNGDLTNAKIIPDSSKPNIFYRIASARLCSMLYGDVNGDGIVDNNDLILLNNYVGIDLNTSPPANSQITDGYTTMTVVNGYKTLTNPFTNDFSLSFRVVDPATNLVKASGNDGGLVADPTNPALAAFQSASTNFFDPSYIIGNMKLVITASSNSANIGEFSVLNAFPDTIDPTKSHILQIEKQFISPDIFKQLLRSDIDGDFAITATDGYLLQNYINKVPPFPPSTTPSSKIGTQFNVLEIVVDPFLYNDVANTLPDRTDDYPSTATNRASTLHVQQDIFLNDGYMQSHNFKLSPITFNIIKQLTWEDYLITAAGSGRFVPTIFGSISGFNQNDCELIGVSCEKYSDPPDFDPGTIDVFVPNNLIIGAGGGILNDDGSSYKVDLEMSTITLEIPNTVLGQEQTIDLFNYFVVDHNNTGRTSFGFPALRFADCSTVQSTAIANNQIRFAVAPQSLSPALNGQDVDDGYTGIIVDGKIGIYIDHATGLLRLNFGNLYQDPVLLTLNTKVQVNVYLKKSGFNNRPLFVNSTQMANLLTLLGS